MKNGFALGGAILWAASLLWSQSVPRGATFLVKLSESLDTRTSRPGDKVGAVVIAPVCLRGGRLEGAVDEAQGPRLRFSFHLLRFSSRTATLRTQIISVVNSKGEVSRDDLGQTVRVEAGTVVAEGPATALHEGAEIRLIGEER